MRTVLREFLAGLFLIILLSLILPHILYGQEPSTAMANPEAWSFMKHGGNTSVDHYTGRIGLSIPIYTYEDPDFKIPLSLSYGSGGYLPELEPGIMGMGWAINAGGYVTRTVRGMPDDKKEDIPEAVKSKLDTYSKNKQYIGFYREHKTTSNIGSGLSSANRYPHKYPVTGTGWSYDGKVYGDFVETEPDIFHFKFGNHSGDFMFLPARGFIVYNTNGESGEYEIQLEGFDPDQAMDNDERKKITIRTNDGFTYIFAGDPRLSRQDYQTEIYTTGTNPPEPSLDTEYNRSWPLTKIIAPNGRVVTFEYIPHTYKKRDRQPVGFTHVYDHSNRPIETRHNTSRGGDVDVESSLLSSINIGGNASIDFEYNENFRLIAVQIASELGISTTSRRFTMNYNENKDKYFGMDILTEIVYPSGETYTMEYYDCDYYPTNLKMDHWGFATDSPGYIDWSLSVSGPPIYSQFPPRARTGREPSFEPSLFGVIKKITYPTGGYTIIEYEPHVYSHVARRTRTGGNDLTLETSDPTNAGGVRVKKITNYASQNNYMSKEFVYGDGNRLGHLIHYPIYSREMWRRLQCPNGIYREEDQINGGFIPYRERIVECSTVDYINMSLSGTHIEYPCVTEVHSDGSSIKYRFSDFRTYPDYNNPHNYGTPSIRNLPLYFWHTYTKVNDPYNVLNCYDYFIPFDSSVAHLDWERITSRADSRGKLLSTEMFDADGNMVLKEIMSYSNWSSTYTSYTVGIVSLLPFDIYMPKAYPSGKTTIEYLDNDSITRQVSTRFNGFGSPSKNTTTRSDGKILTQEFFYPQELQNSDPIYRIMTERRLIKGPVRTFTTLKDAGSTQTYIIEASQNYFELQDSCIVLKQEKTSKFLGTVPYEQFNHTQHLVDGETFSYGRYGRPIASCDRNGITTTYVWGYDWSYPVAKIHNATPYQVEEALGVDLQLFCSNRHFDIPDMERLNALRRHPALVGAQITTVEYRPMYGPVKIIDETGRALRYDYDYAGRLSSVRDEDGNILNAYEYNIGL